MNCTHPLYALVRCEKSDGVFNLKLLPQRADQYNRFELERKYGSENILPIPCGKCLACKTNYAKEWSLRCMLEASRYPSNWFLTLTYDDEHLPDDGKISKDDLRTFIKDLRYRIPGFRYIASAEYGEHTHRAHYHLILFNCNIPDLKYMSKGRLGGAYFDSKLISNVWSKGHITLGYVTPGSCEYVARYTLKKISGDEFITMSLKPGLGASYFYDNLDKIYKNDGVYLKGFKYKVPRYFDKLMQRVSPSRFKTLKAKRLFLQRERFLSSLSVSKVNNVEDLYAINNQALLSKYKEKLKGGLL